MPIPPAPRALAACHGAALLLGAPVPCLSFPFFPTCFGVAFFSNWPSSFPPAFPGFPRLCRCPFSEPHQHSNITAHFLWGRGRRPWAPPVFIPLLLAPHRYNSTQHRTVFLASPHLQVKASLHVCLSCATPVVLPSPGPTRQHGGAHSSPMLLRPAAAHCLQPYPPTATPALPSPWNP